MTLAQQVTQLQEAIASGALRIKDNDKETTFRSLDEMQEILAGLQAQLLGVKRVNTTYASFSRGDR